MLALTRRSFLASTTLAATGVAACSRAFSAPDRDCAKAERRPSPRVDPRWTTVREQFALSPDWVHLASFYLASHPRPVREAITRYRDELDANPFQAVNRGESAEAGSHRQRVKEAAAAYLGGRADEVALTQSTTMGLATVYHALSLSAGDEVLLTTHDHYSHQESARLACERSGASLRKFSLYDKFEELPQLTVDKIVARVEAAIAPATRVLGLTWVHSASGLRLPLRRIAEAVQKVNSQRKEEERIVFVVDGVHGLGVIDETVADIGCDIFVSGTHKWIFGPRGTGLIWAKPETWATMRPLVPTFDSQEPWNAWLQGREASSLPRAEWFTPGGFHAFEHEWAVADAFKFHASIGRRAIALRIAELNRQLKEGLSRIPRVTVWTPRLPALSAGIVGFDIAGFMPDLVVSQLLESKIIGSVSPYARPVARLAAGIMNTPQEIDAAIAAVRRIAAA